MRRPSFVSHKFHESSALQPAAVDALCCVDCACMMNKIIELIALCIAHISSLDLPFSGAEEKDARQQMHPNTCIVYGDLEFTANNEMHF